MKQIINLEGKKILVLGASSGMGRETAILLSQIGAKCILVARREDKLVEVVNELEGTGHKYYPFDLSQIKEIEGLIKTIIADNGPLDGYVHSAGTSNYRPLAMLKPDKLVEVMTINFYSFVETVRCLTKKGCLNENSSIVGISSTSSKRGNQTKTAYAASKAAMDAAVRCMAKELAPKKIRVNTVVPSFIKTDMYEIFIDKSGDSQDGQSILSRQYLGVGEPIDVANLIAFLLSDASKFITGSSVDIDGGRLSS